MGAVEIEDLYCRDCGKRGVLIADQFGHCVECASINVVRVVDMTADEREALDEE